MGALGIVPVNAMPASPIPKIEALDLPLVEAALEQQAGVVLFIKDAALRYVSANRPMARLCGVAGKAELIGKSARDFFPDSISRLHEEQDRRVMRTRMPASGRLAVCIRDGARPAWLALDRRPVLDPSGIAVGVMGVGRSLDHPDVAHPMYPHAHLLAKSMRRFTYCEADCDDLAQRLGLTPAQLDQAFEAVYGVPPRRYYTRVRIGAALDMLATRTEVAKVAHACGYADQSAFTRRFKALVGVSPRAHRRVASAPVR